MAELTDGMLVDSNSLEDRLIKLEAAITETATRARNLETRIDELEETTHTLIHLGISTTQHVGVLIEKVKLLMEGLN
jgi:hypothetical protein